MFWKLKKLEVCHNDGMCVNVVVNWTIINKMRLVLDTFLRLVDFIFHDLYDVSLAATDDIRSRALGSLIGPKALNGTAIIRTLSQS